VTKDEMKTFKDWLQNVEERIAAETATTTGGGGGFYSNDIAGNPYGAGPTYADGERKRRVDKMNGGRSKPCTKDNGKCGLAGDGKIMMKFSSGKTLHDTD